MENASTVNAGKRLTPSLKMKRNGRLVDDAQRELQMMGSRTNLLLIGADSVIRTVLQMLQQELGHPIVDWHPGQALTLPSPGRASTLVLHDVCELSREDQSRLLRWLDQTAGRVRVVSTTAGQLWPRVSAGAFNDALYYRLNTVCVNLVDPEEETAAFG